MNRQASLYLKVYFLGNFLFVYLIFHSKISIAKHNFVIFILRMIWYSSVVIGIPHQTWQRIKTEATVPGTVYGYIRVSSKDQHTDRQSGKDFNRPHYKNCCGFLSRKTVLS